jgi:hypothetical protein
MRWVVNATSRPLYPRKRPGTLCIGGWAGHVTRVEGTRGTYRVLKTAFFWAITQRLVLIPYRRFGVTYRSHLQGSRNQLDSLPLRMVPIGCLEMSVRNYHYLLRNSPEKRSSHLLRGRSLISRMQGFDGEI